MHGWHISWCSLVLWLHFALDGETEGGGDTVGWLCPSWGAYNNMISPSLTPLQPTNPPPECAGQRIRWPERRPETYMGRPLYGGAHPVEQKTAGCRRVGKNIGMGWDGAREIQSMILCQAENPEATVGAQMWYCIAPTADDHRPNKVVKE